MSKLSPEGEEQSKIQNMVMSGGVALNAVCNMKLCETGIFDDVWVQPQEMPEVP